jgi:biopolymer transport protein TolR
MAFDVGAGKGKKGRAAPNMNVTPLVDVVLVLLIIFLVITPMMAKQFWLVLPQKPDKQEQVKEPDEKDKTIVVTLANTGEIRINHEAISKDAFSDKLRRYLQGTGERTIFFDADRAAKFGIAMEVMDRARQGGAAHIVVMTEPFAGR